VRKVFNCKISAAICSRANQLDARKGGTAPQFEDAYSSDALPTYISEGKAGTESVGMYAVHSATLPSETGRFRDAKARLPPLQPESRGLFRPFESDEISEFSTLGAKGKIAFEIYALVANCPLSLIC